jgi:uridine kinase
VPDGSERPVPVDDVVKRVTSLRQSLSRITLVGISGIDCAGKSTFARDLARALGLQRTRATILHGDEFTRPRRARPAAAGGPLDYYESIDYSELCSRIIPAARTGHPPVLDIRVTDWERDGWLTHRLALEATDVLIVEGSFLFRDSRHALFDLSIWLEIDRETALRRAEARPRDLERFGSPAAVREHYETRYLPAQELHLERDRPARDATMVMRSPP